MLKSSMDLFNAIEKRKSIRKFTDKDVPTEVIEKALEASLLAPNSSNMQTWDFFWVQSSDKKKQLIQFCLNQSAARTAKELIVITADPNQWKRSLPHIHKFIEEVNAPRQVITYYHKLIPYFYRHGFFNVLGFPKSLLSRFVSLFKPMMNGPHLKSELQEVAIKSAALAAQNFVLAITAQGYSTCMMEGFDHSRVKKLLNLNSSGKVVMVIAVGEESEKGTWGPRFRIDPSHVIHKV